VLRDERDLDVTRLRKHGELVWHQRLAGQVHGFFTLINALPGS
jgi:acetyl esterase